jgi:hypothetical protein
VQVFEIFANRDERSIEAPREVFDDDAAVAIEDFKNFAATLFTEHSFRAFWIRNG